MDSVNVRWNRAVGGIGLVKERPEERFSQKIGVT